MAIQHATHLKLEKHTGEHTFDTATSAVDELHSKAVGNLLSLLSIPFARLKTSPSKCDVSLNRSGGYQLCASVPLSKLVGRDVQIPLLTCADNSDPKPYLDVQGTPVAVASNRWCVPLIFVTSQSWKCPEQNFVGLHFYGIGDVALLGLKGNVLLSSLVAREKTSPSKFDVSFNRSGGYQRSAFVPLSKLVGRDVQIPLLTCADNSDPKPNLDVQGTRVAVASNRRCVPLIIVTSQSWKCPEQNFVGLHFYGVGYVALLGLEGNLLFSSLVARQKTSPSKCGTSLNRSGGYQLGASVSLSKLVGRDVQIRLLTCADNSDPKPYLDVQGTPVAVASNRPCAPLIFVTSQSRKCPEQNVVDLHFYRIGEAPLLRLKGNLLSLLSSLVARQKTSPSKCGISLNRSGGYQLGASVSLSKLVGRDVQIRLLTCADNSDPKPYLDVQGTPVAVASNQRCAPLIFATSFWKCPEQNVVGLHQKRPVDVALLEVLLLSSLVAREKTSPSKCDVSLNRSGGYRLGASVPLSKLVGRDVQIRLLTCADNSDPKPYLDVQGTPVAVASNRPCAPLIFATSQSWKCPEQNVIALHFYRIGEAPLLRLKGNLLSLLSSLVARQKTSPSKCGISLNRSGGYQLGASVSLSKLVGRDVQIRLLTCADNSDPKPYLDVQGTPVAVASNRPCAPLIFVTSQSRKCPEQNVVDLHFYGIGDVALLGLKGNVPLSSLVAREKTSPSKCDVSLNRSGGYQRSAFVPLSKLVGRDVQIPLLTCADNSHPKLYLDVQGTPVAVASNRWCVPLIFATSQSWKCPEQNVVDLHFYGIGEAPLLRLKGNLLSLLSSLIAREKTSPSKCDISLNRSGGYQRTAFVPLSKLVGRDVQIPLLTCADNSDPEPYLDMQGTPVAVASNRWYAPLIFVTSQSRKCPEQNVVDLHFYGIGGMALLGLEGNLLSLLSSLVARQKTSPSKCDVSLNRSGGYHLGASFPLSKLVGRDVQIRLLTCADNSDPKPYLDMQGTPVAVASNRRCVPLIFVTSQSWKCPEQNVVDLHFYGIGEAPLLGLEGNLLSLLSSLIARQKTSPSKCGISLNRSGGYQLGVPFALSKLVGRDVQIRLLTCADNSHPKPFLDVQGTPVAVASNRPCAPLIFVTSFWKYPEQNVVGLHQKRPVDMALLEVLLLSSLVARQKTSPSKCGTSLNQSGGYQLCASVPLLKLVERDVLIRHLTCADNSDPKPYLDVQGTPVAVASNQRCAPLIFVTSQSWKCPEQNVGFLHSKGIGGVTLLGLKGNWLSLLSSLVARQKTSPSKCDISLHRSGGFQLVASVPLSKLVGRDVQIPLLTVADSSNPNPFFDMQGTRVAVASNRRCVPLIFVTSQSWKCPEQNVVGLRLNGIGGVTLLGLKGNWLSLLSSLVARQKTSPSKCDISLHRSGGYQHSAFVPLSKLVGRDVQIPLLTVADSSNPNPFFDMQGTRVAVASNQPCAPLIFVSPQSWKCPEQNVGYLHFYGIGEAPLLRLKGNLLSLLSSLIARQKTSPSKCGISLNRSGGFQLGVSVPLSKLVGRDVQIPLLTCADNSDPKPYLDVQGTPVAVASNQRCVPLISVTSFRKYPEQNVVGLHQKRPVDMALLEVLLLSSLVARQKTSPSKCGTSLNQSGGYQLGVPFALSKLVGRDVLIRHLTCADNSDPKPYLDDVQGTPVAVASNRRCVPLIIVTSQSWKCPEQNVVDLHFYRIGDLPLLGLEGNLLLLLLSSLVARQKTSPSKFDVSFNRSGGYQRSAFVPLSKLVGMDVQIPLLTCADNSHPKLYLDVQGTPVAVASNRRCAPLIFVTSQSWKCPEQNVGFLHSKGIGGVTLLGLKGNWLSLLSSLVARQKTSPSKCDISLHRSGGFQLVASVPLSKLVGRDVQIPLLTVADSSNPNPFFDMQGTRVAVASNRRCVPLIFVTSQSWKCPEQNVVGLHLNGIGGVTLLGLKGNWLSLLSSLVARQKTSPSKCDISLHRSGGYQHSAFVPLSKLVGRDAQIPLLTVADSSNPNPFFDMQGTRVAVASNQPCAPLIFVSPQSWKCPEQNAVDLHLNNGIGGMTLLRLEGNLLSLLSSLVARQKTSPSKCDVSLNRSGGFQLVASVPLSKLVGRDVQIPLLTVADSSNPNPFFDMQGTRVAVASNRRCVPLIFVTSQSWKCPEQNVVDLHFYGIGDVALLGLKGNVPLSSLVARQNTSPSKCDVSLNRSGGYQLCASVPLSKLVGRDVQIPLLTCPNNSDLKPYLDMQGTRVAVASNRPCAPLIFVSPQSWKCPEQNAVDLHLNNGIGGMTLLRLEGNLLSLLSSLVARQMMSPSKCGISLNRSGGFQLVASVPLSKLVGRDVQIPLLTCPNNSDLKPYLDMQGTRVAVASNRPCAPLIFVSPQSWKCPEQNAVDLHLNNGIGGMTLLRLEGNLLSLLSSLVARQMMSPSKCGISLNRSGGFQLVAFVPLSNLVGRDVQIPLLTCPDNSDLKPYLDVQGTPVAVASNRRRVPLIFVTSQSRTCREHEVVNPCTKGNEDTALIVPQQKLLLHNIHAIGKSSPSERDNGVSLYHSGRLNQHACLVESFQMLPLGHKVNLSCLTFADRSDLQCHSDAQGSAGCSYLHDMQRTAVLSRRVAHWQGRNAYMKPAVWTRSIRQLVNSLDSDGSCLQVLLPSRLDARKVEPGCFMLGLLPFQPRTWPSAQGPKAAQFALHFTKVIAVVLHAAMNGCATIPRVEPHSHSGAISKPPTSLQMQKPIHQSQDRCRSRCYRIRTTQYHQTYQADTQGQAALSHAIFALNAHDTMQSTWPMMNIAVEIAEEGALVHGEADAVAVRCICRLHYASLTLSMRRLSLARPSPVTADLAFAQSSKSLMLATNGFRDSRHQLPQQRCEARSGSKWRFKEA